MSEERINEAELAGSLYEELQAALGVQSDVRQFYRLLNRTFLTSLNQKTQIAGVRFNGSFAKTDYLLKEFHASRHLRNSVNDARVRLRRQNELSDDELAMYSLSDLKSVAQFISLVYAQPIPDSLSAVFPKARRRTMWKVRADYLRVIVNRWDDDYIFVDASEGENKELRVRYSADGEQFPTDWGYLRDCLYEGCQLNIVRPREHEGVLYPELFIFEPDFLVDISAIASCFESYAESPVCYLLNKIKTVKSTPAIMLGHIASQFLDDELYSGQTETPYAECAKKFFRQHAIGLLEAGVDRQFHAEAQQQRRNIQNTLRQVLPSLLKSDNMSFDSSDLMVEPSFFSEMLGLQGRIDLLHLEQRLLIEQKSGKGAYPQPDPNTPSCQEKHYVQLLLYMLLFRYNYRQQYELNNRELHSFLYYSKYQNGLLAMGFAPDLVFRAIKMRNGIVANEYAYSKSGFSILENLTPEQVCNKPVGRNFWERYIYPQLSELLSPISEASELERAYYLRLLSFVETEHILAKIGSQSKENSGFADKWYSSLDDKLLAGNIFTEMEMLSPEQNETGRVERVVLRMRHTDDTDVSNFRCGDIVIFYPYQAGSEPDARKTMVFRATIEEITATELTLHLRAAQTNARAFWHRGEHLWAVEHDFFDSSFGSLYRGVHSFLSAPKRRRDLILLQRKPEVDKDRGLMGDYGQFNNLALKVKQAKDLFLIIGPPGTGKTSYGLVNTLKEQLLSEGSSVLLLSYTNRAVDEICDKLVECGIDFVRIGSRYSCKEEYKAHLLDSKVDGCTNIDQLKYIIQQTRVFVGTTTAFNSNTALFKIKQFDLAVVDEASQILEPHLLGLLSAVDGVGESAIKKIVMIGDHKQLPAVVQQNEADSRVDDERLNAVYLSDCRLSLFERLLKAYRYDEDVVYMLTRQGRMHIDIADYPSKAFYGDKLQVVPLAHQQEALCQCGDADNPIDRLLSASRIAFVDIDKPKQSLSDKVNTAEAEAIAATIERIYLMNESDFSPSQTVGVIVPYRNQIAEIRNALSRRGIDVLSKITIDTVERFQGSQRDYIVYGFTVQKYYQLQFLTNNVFEESGCIIDRKLNVVMTRARKHLLLFGNASLLNRSIVFRNLLDYMKQKNSFFHNSF